MAIIEAWFNHLNYDAQLRNFEIREFGPMFDATVDGTRIVYSVMGSDRIVIHQVIRGPGKFRVLDETEGIKFYIQGLTEKVVVGFMPTLDEV